VLAHHCAVRLPSLLLLLLLLLQVAEIATLFDDDGILVRFMNSNTEGNSVRCVTHTRAAMQQSKQILRRRRRAASGSCFNCMTCAVLVLKGR
jgi:hypothetical protein